MSNEELKKKIVKILANCKCEECAVEYCADCEGNPSIEHCREKQQADALIAAGIVDKSDYASMKETAVRYKAEVSKAKGRAKEAEHRAARAEKALMTVCVNVVTDEEDDIAVEPRARVLYRAYLKQAEKELAEEGK